MTIEELFAACEAARPDLCWSAEDDRVGHYRVSACGGDEGSRSLIVTVGYDRTTGLTVIIRDGRPTHHQLRAPSDLTVLLRSPRQRQKTAPPSLRSRRRRKT